MPHAARTRPLRSSVGVRGAASRFAVALCAAVLAAVGLGGAAAPAIGAAAGGPWNASTGPTGGGPIGGGPGSGGPTGTGSAAGGYGATPTPAAARAAGYGALSGTANRVRPASRHENSKPAFAITHRGQPDVLPVAVVAARHRLTDPILPAGPALTGAPTRAPPASLGLPDTRAPPATGRS